MGQAVGQAGQVEGVADQVARGVGEQAGVVGEVVEEQ